MKHWYVTGPGRLEVVDESLPAPGDGEVLIRVMYTALSPGSNLHAYLHGTYGETPKTGRVDVVYMGSGIIEDVGAGVDRERIGERVAFNGLGHQEVGTLPSKLAHNVPDGVDLDAASLAYLAAWSVSALHLGAYAAAETVAVVGLGLVGASAALVSDAAGARVLGLDVDGRRLELAERLDLGQVGDARCLGDSDIRGFLGDDGVDLIIETSGAWSGFRTGMSLARDYSRIALMGIYREPPRHDLLPSLHQETFGFPSKMHYQRVQIIGCGSDPDSMPEPTPRNATRVRNFRWVLEQAARGRLPLSSLVTSVVPADRIESELSQLAAGDTSQLGIVFDWSSL